MAKAWKEVIASQQYQSLLPEQKAHAQEQYFNEVVAPQAGVNAAAAKQAFFSAYPTAIEQHENPSTMWQQPSSPTPQSAAWGENQPQTRGQQIGEGLAETGRAALQAGVNVANIPAEITDAIVSAGSWLGNKLGLGDGAYSNAPRLTTEGIEQALGLNKGTLTPRTEEGQVFAEALPYLTPVGLERVVTSSPSIAGRIANLGARLTAENTTGALAANSGTDNNGSFAGDLALGVAAGGAVHGVVKGVGAAARAYGQRGVDEAAGNLRDIVTQGRQASPIDRTGQAIAESPESSILSRNVKVDGAEGQSASISAQAYRAAEEVRPNQQILDAAKRLGVDELLIPSHFSNNPTYRAIEQGLKSVPASQLAAQEGKAIQSLAQKADDFITMSGGSLDKSELSQRFKENALSHIADLDNGSTKIYDEISGSIPKNQQVAPTKTIGLLDEVADNQGGSQYLSPMEKKAYDWLDPKGSDSSLPTFGRLDALRRQVGQAINKRSGPFKDEESGTLKRLYSTLTDDQEAAVKASGLGDKWSVAKGLVQQRKQLEDNLVGVIGKDLNGAITSSAGTAIKSLRTGDYKQFDQLINRVPPSMRQEVVVSALNDAFTLASRKEGQLSIPGFVDWYAGLAKNKGALARVEKHLPEGAANRLKDIYIVAQGIRTAKSSEITTGRIQSLLDQFDKDGGMISRIYSIGKKAAAAEGISSSVGLPGAGAASVIASNLAAKKTARTVAADQMIASRTFRSAVRMMAGRDSARLSAARAGVEKALMRSREYQRWSATLDSRTKQAIAKVGLLNWLGGTGDDLPNQR